MDFFRRDLLRGVAAIAVGATGATELIPTPANSATPASASGAVYTSVRDFGAEGDGRTDDFTAISKAIASIAARSVTDEPGGVLWFPAGSYRSSNPLVVPKNILLAGESPYATRLTYTGGGADFFIRIGQPGVIAEYSGVESMWIDCAGKADVAIELWGPQEGSRVSEVMAVGARTVVVDVHSSGIEGGSNKFVIEKSWLWTSGDNGLAGIRLGAESGPLSIRDSTVVGTNRSNPPGPGSAGVLVSDSKVTIDNVNVEHFENYAMVDRTIADIRSPTAFHTTNGVVTSKDSAGYPLIITNGLFDDVVAAVQDGGAGVTLAYCSSYVNAAHPSQKQSFGSGTWDIGAANVYGSATAQTRMGYQSDATDDVSRFKLTSMVGGRWVESAAVDGDGLFGSAESAYDGAHLRIGAYHLWVDSSGQLRMNHGLPSSDGDGTVLGQA